MDEPASTTSSKLGPYTPTLILHGGAGSITRSHLPPELYHQYVKSLSSYVTSASTLLQSGHSALDAACHAVSLMEDEPLFNCGKGAVFTSEGEIEMEASVMVSSVDSNWTGDGSVKRGAAVMLVRETRHPILLAREVLLQGDGDQQLGSMHCQRSGRSVEEWGWKERGLERKGKEWFWTKKRWEEHLRGLEKEQRNPNCSNGIQDLPDHDGECDQGYGEDLPSQGTVGAVCMDSWGVLAVATSTGGLTNKKPGRIGDTPTLGAGFWAESWEEREADHKSRSLQPTGPAPAAEDFGRALLSCMPGLTPIFRLGQEECSASNGRQNEKMSQPYVSPPSLSSSRSHPRIRRRAMAASGTGNGDSFLRTNAVRTAAAMCRFGGASLGQAITNVAGYDGELQESAGCRWGSGEGEGGVIGIEAVSNQNIGRIVAKFNCGGMWRAWIDEKSGEAKVMVFREEYEQ